MHLQSLTSLQEYLNQHKVNFMIRKMKSSLYKRRYVEGNQLNVSKTLYIATVIVMVLEFLLGKYENALVLGIIALAGFITQPISKSLFAKIHSKFLKTLFSVAIGLLFLGLIILLHKQITGGFL